MRASTSSPTKRLYSSNCGDLFKIYSSFASWTLFCYRYYFLIDLSVFLSHHLGREMALHMQARCLSVDLLNFWDRLYHLIEILHEKACFAIRYNLGSGPLGKRDDRTA